MPRLFPGIRNEIRVDKCLNLTCRFYNRVTLRITLTAFMLRPHFSELYAMLASILIFVLSNVFAVIAAEAVTAVLFSKAEMWRQWLA